MGLGKDHPTWKSSTGKYWYIGGAFTNSEAIIYCLGVPEEVHGKKKKLLAFLRERRGSLCYIPHLKSSNSKELVPSGNPLQLWGSTKKECMDWVGWLSFVPNCSHLARLFHKSETRNEESVMVSVVAASVSAFELFGGLGLYLLTIYLLKHLCYPSFKVILRDLQSYNVIQPWRFLFRPTNFPHPLKRPSHGSKECQLES